jgi:hypothetical protein
VRKRTGALSGLEICARGVESAPDNLERTVLFLTRGRVVPALDIAARACGPGADPGPVRVEEVERERSDVDVMLGALPS